MKEYKYKILNPGGNKTALVLGNEYSVEEKKIINNEILKNNKDVEQVAFISLNENKLDMAGGEFCMNATRCAVYEYLKGKAGEIKIYSAGIDLEGGINNQKEVYVKIPINKQENEIIIKNNEYSIVKLDGILLIVMDEVNSKKYINILKEDENNAKIELKKLMIQLKTKEKAVGIILLEENSKVIKIHPVIWVKEIDTVYYETACGSGSLATAIYLNSISQANSFIILQPSKYIINVKLDIKDNYLINAVVSGVVEE